MTELNSRRLEIDALRALSAIRQHGGITRAAVALGLSQSAVSHKIKRLEVSLDCELLGRKSGGPMFTAAGEDLLDYAGRILGLHDEALLSLSKTPLAGRLLLGLTEDTACTDLARIFGRFRRLHPNVAVRTKVRMSLVLRAMLERGELDAAIVQVFSHEVRPNDVVLYKEDLHWVKHPELMLRKNEPIPTVGARHRPGRFGSRNRIRVFECRWNCVRRERDNGCSVAERPPYPWRDADNDRPFACAAILGLRCTTGT